jgi:hypothetical protein
MPFMVVRILPPLNGVLNEVSMAKNGVSEGIVPSDVEIRNTKPKLKPFKLARSNQLYLVIDKCKIELEQLPFAHLDAKADFVGFVAGGNRT